MNHETREKLSNIAYYLIIGIVSLVVMVFVPMIGSEAGLEIDLPNTATGWLVYVISKLSVAILNMIIYYCFMQQAKINVKDNEKFIKAKEILHKESKKRETKPLSPHKWNALQYGWKGTSLFIGSIVSAVGFSCAVLKFDLLTFMSLAFTLISGIVFGYLQMRKAEEYWTGEFYEYALMVQSEPIKEEPKEEIIDGIQNRRDDLQESSGTSQEESV